jgi:hypothetical protein
MNNAIRHNAPAFAPVRKWPGMGVLLLVGLLVAAPARAVINVTPANETELADAIADANAAADDTVIDLQGRTILLTAALPPITNNTHTITLKDGTLRRDPGAPEFRVFRVNAGAEATLDQVTITGGANGGVLNIGTLTLTNSTVSGNSADGSTGSISNGGTLTLINSTVSGNSTGGSIGGISNSNDGTLTLINSTVSGNYTGGSIGGISNSIGGTLTLINSTVSGNSAEVSAGGIANLGTLTLINSTVSGNSARRDGGISNAGTLTIMASTISGNRADEDNGGLSIYGGSNNLKGSIVAGNTDSSGPSDCVGTITSQGYNVIGDTAGCTITLQASDVEADPLLGGLTDNGGPTQTHAIPVDSPAVNRYDAATCAADFAALMAPIVPPVDQRGVTRPQGGDCDSGAFEAVLPVGGVRLWVSDATSNGNLGGRDGANMICATDTNRPSLLANHVAFLTVDPDDEIVDLPVNYPSLPTDEPILRRDGIVQIDMSFAGLLDGMLQAAVDPGSSGAWTGSNSDGTLALNCFGFDSAIPALTGAIGQPADTSGDWLNNDTATCPEHYSIYCLSWGEPDLDFGDAPLSTDTGFLSNYPTLFAEGGAAHAFAPDDPVLGTRVDAEADGQPNATATGDGADEDGITATTAFVAGTTATVTFDVSRSEGGMDMATIDAWIDYNADGDWDDAGEYVLMGLPVTVSTGQTANINIPATAVTNTLIFARIRITNAGFASPRGLAPDGEVEDWPLIIAPEGTDPADALPPISGIIRGFGGSAAVDDDDDSCSGTDYLLLCIGGSDPLVLVVMGLFGLWRVVQIRRGRGSSG